jgi:hypothetical protein
MVNDRLHEDRSEDSDSWWYHQLKIIDDSAFGENTTLAVVLPKMASQVGNYRLLKLLFRIDSLTLVKYHLRLSADSRVANRMMQADGADGTPDIGMGGDPVCDRCGAPRLAGAGLRLLFHVVFVKVIIECLHIRFV